MQLFRGVNVDWIGRKWLFIGASFALFVVSLISLISKGGPRYGIDFRGGTLVYVKFRSAPPLDQIRANLKRKGLGESTIQRFGPEGDHEVIISLEQAATEGGAELDQGRRTIEDTLNLSFRPPEAQAGKLDLNNIRSATVFEGALAGNSSVVAAIQKAGVTEMKTVQDLGNAVVQYRTAHGGLISDFEELKKIPGVSEQIVTALKEKFYLGDFAVRSTEIVGAKVGKNLQRQAISATLYALGGMLAYIAWRFKGTVYGTAAVVAVFHDVIITLGFFSFLNKEISLTVIAALLTLVGYSMNDTIVVFDRIRENLKLLRREPLESVINKSINQTLSRTILTSGLTFLTVVSLYLFGGEVINGFAFAMLVGIAIGTYSSIAVASPLLVIWYNYRNSKINKKKMLAKA
jgi:preprotein translocase subunit SecF